MLSHALEKLPALRRSTLAKHGLKETDLFIVGLCGAHSCVCDSLDEIDWERPYDLMLQLPFAGGVKYVDGGDYTKCGVGELPANADTKFCVVCRPVSATDAPEPVLVRETDDRPNPLARGLSALDLGALSANAKKLLGRVCVFELPTAQRKVEAQTAVQEQHKCAICCVDEVRGVKMCPIHSSLFYVQSRIVR